MKVRSFWLRCIERNSNGFTLVEMLVAVAVISLLISILLPALSMSLKNARLMLCATHQKHIGAAIHNYASENASKIPYGPTAEPSSIADFYVVDGMVSSQFSLLHGGKPVGIGLLLADHLDLQSSVLFCPDTDQPFDAERERKRFGHTQAVSGYFYRHGSNTLESLSMPRDTWDDHIMLSDLGTNRNGQRIGVLLMDQNFVVDPPVLAFNIVTRTNHQRRRTNALFSDGHVEALDNADQQYVANVGDALYQGPHKILTVLERADTQ